MVVVGGFSPGHAQACGPDRVDVKTLFIEPGSPWENGNVESFNGKLRDERLNREISYTLPGVGAWRDEMTKSQFTVCPFGRKSPRGRSRDRHSAVRTRHPCCVFCGPR